MSLYIYCCGGLSNRLNSIATSLLITRDLKNYSNKPYLIWPQNNWCMASADEVFCQDWINRNFSKVINEDIILSQKSSNLMIISHNPIHRDYVEEFYSIYKLPFIKNKIKKSKNPVVFHSDLAPWWINFDKFRAVFKNIEYSSKIKEYEKKIHDHIGPFKYGMHIRQSDFSSSYGILLCGLNKAIKIARRKK